MNSRSGRLAVIIYFLTCACNTSLHAQTDDVQTVDARTDDARTDAAQPDAALVDDARAAAAIASFDQQVAPILAANCLDCHNANEKNGGVDLSSQQAAAAGGESGRGTVARSLDESLIWQRISDDEMPPEHPLSAAEKQTLRNWIVGGAAWGSDPIDPFRYSSSKRAGYDWWSLRPLEKPQVPTADNDPWSQNAIDRFIAAKLTAHGLSPSPRADPRTLVWRIYFNLLGLPAPPEAIDRFAQDPSQQHWEQVVDELLASKHYGERWARHWLDVVRFGESDGYEDNGPRKTAWHYRDWVIRSLNEDLPYDQFARMQLAGDILQPNTLEGVAAVGFLVAGVHNTILGNVAGMKLAARHEELEEMAGTVAQTFLGLTVNCAHCHDHKFDPISNREYFQFIAALKGVTHGERNIHLHDEAAAPLDADRAQTEGDAQVFSVVSADADVMRIFHRGDVARPGDEVAPAGLQAIQNISPSLASIWAPPMRRVAGNSPLGSAIPPTGRSIA